MFMQATPALSKDKRNERAKTAILVSKIHM